MLSVLYSTLNKSKTDDSNSQMKLASCAELFDPIHDRIGSSTGLWQSVPRHPIFLALGIKSLIARGVFSPEPSEVAEEVKTDLVAQKREFRSGLRRDAHHCSQACRQKAFRKRKRRKGVTAIPSDAKAKPSRVTAIPTRRVA
jgi:hypothetical protein